MGFLFGLSQGEGKEEVIGDINSVDAEGAVETGATDSEAPVTEHYDGAKLSDVFVNYDPLHMRGFGPVHFIETRKYLQQVRDQKRHIEMLEKRIGYRKDADLDTDWHEEELETAKEQLKSLIAEVAEEIGKLPDVNQEVVMTKRYIDVMAWDEIAMEADLSMRTVQKCHGRALPRMEEILVADGLITLQEESDE